MLTLRPYQAEAVETVMAALVRDRAVLMQAATGAGKTVMFCEIIKRMIQGWPDVRVAVLAHRRELITQAAEKLLKVWPEAPLGLACAGVSGNVNVDAPVVAGSVQTLARRKMRRPFHLLVVDEAHRIPPLKDGQGKSQYHRVINRLRNEYADLRVLGVTATPYRLGHGYIYGTRCKPGHGNIFPDLHYRIGMAELQADGYLVPIRAKEGAALADELSGVKSTGGDFNLGELGAVMSRPVHIETAVQAYGQYGEGRRHVLIFCVTIRHAELVSQAFEAAGYTTGMVHSEMNTAKRDRTLARFAAGDIRILANVGVLTEGWDCPETDLIMLCRPTKSPALFVQMVGRGTRTAKGKTDCLVLDLGENFKTHGDPNNPRVSVPGKGTERQEGGGPVMKPCPRCKNLVPVPALECPECGHLWPAPELAGITGKVEMRDIEVGPKPGRVWDFQFEPYVSRAGNGMVKVTLCVEGPKGGRQQVSHFVDIEGRGSSFGQVKARRWWKRHAGDWSVPPVSIEEFISRAGELAMPEAVALEQDGNYRRVVGW